MDHVYVVTYSPKGAEDWQFHKEEAYARIEDAEAAAIERMKILGKHLNSSDGTFTLVDTKNSAHQNVVKRWDSYGKYGMTVWLERLEVQE